MTTTNNNNINQIESNMAAKGQRTFEDFEPPVETSEEDGCSILTMYIPGFSKEQIRVQVSSTRQLRISGERPYKNKAWQRFHKEFQIPPNCNTTNITAKFKGGILHIRQPLRDDSKPPHTAAPKAQPPEQRQAEEPDKKSSPAGNEKVEATISTKETKGSASDIGNHKIASRAGRLKEVVPGVTVKLILPISLAVLVFLFFKRLREHVC